MNSIYAIYPALSPLIGIISIPHGGETIPELFRPYLVNNTRDLQQDIDYRTYDLLAISELQKNGIAVIVSHISRACIDLNRPRDKAALHWKENTFGKQIVTSAPSSDVTEEMLTHFYDPYYEKLTELIHLAKQQEVCSIIDFHSMPSKATEFHLKYNPHQEMSRPDICLSDLKGLSCKSSFIEDLKANLQARNLNVTINNPYFGGYLTQYINEICAFDNIQVEINRNKYMDEELFSLKEPEAQDLKKILTQEITALFKKNTLKL